MYQELEGFVQTANAGAIAHLNDVIPHAYSARIALYEKHIGSMGQTLLPSFDQHASMDSYKKDSFLKQISPLYTQEELKTIDRVCQNFERVHLGFVYFSLLNKNLRPLEALRFVQDTQLRTGWQRVDVPVHFNQKVGDHHQSCESLAQLLFFDDPKVELIKQVARYHDIGESVVGDFTPHCPISRDDKTLIETLGIRLLASNPNNPIGQTFQHCFDIYEGHIPEHEDVRIRVKDIDLMELATEALHIARECPEDCKTKVIEKLQEFWNYADSKLITDRAKNFFHSLSTARYHGDLSISEIVQHAHHYMLMSDGGDIGTLLQSFHSQFTTQQSYSR